MRYVKSKATRKTSIIHRKCQFCSLRLWRYQEITGNLLLLEALKNRRVYVEGNGIVILDIFFVFFFFCVDRHCVVTYKFLCHSQAWNWNLTFTNPRVINSTVQENCEISSSWWNMLDPDLIIYWIHASIMALELVIFESLVHPLIRWNLTLHILTSGSFFLQESLKLLVSVKAHGPVSL
jgi:hypothetical protein